MVCGIKQICFFVAVLGICGVAVADPDRQMVSVAIKEDAAFLRVYDGTDITVVKAFWTALSERKITNRQLSVEQWNRPAQRVQPEGITSRITVVISDEFEIDNVAYLSVSGKPDMETVLAIAKSISDSGFKVRLLSEESFKVNLQNLNVQVVEPVAPENALPTK